MVAATLLLLASGTAWADPTPEERERSVSTSPMALERAQVVRSAGQIPADAPVLTRAAARQRVEDMTPLEWLSRFGPISIDRVE
ncbi:MAG: hypothetical protein CL908_01555 [Deltaproteobacteria bacterium]|nr:hypothetical protein [Deltaproteobacteria bacterium]